MCYKVGDIIKFCFTLGYLTPYLHYAVYIGNGEIVHYTKAKGEKKSKIVREKLKDFLSRCSRAIRHFNGNSCFGKPIGSGEKIRDRAISQIGAADYNIVLKNCEHFARWCREGAKTSRQVNVVGIGGVTVVGVGFGTLVGAGVGVVGTGGAATAAGATAGATAGVVGGPVGMAVGVVVGMAVGAAIGTVTGGTVGAVALGVKKLHNKYQIQTGQQF